MQEGENQGMDGWTLFGLRRLPSGQSKCPQKLGAGGWDLQREGTQGSRLIQHRPSEKEPWPFGPITQSPGGCLWPRHPFLLQRN